MKYDGWNKISSWYVLTLTIIFQLLLSYVALEPQVGFDDANITQVYARHLAGGHGFVYNVGGERVEGSTSLIWTTLNAAMFFLHIQSCRLLLFAYC